MRVMGEEPINLSAISRALGEKPGKIRFHLMKLLDAGLIKHVEDRVVGGHVEKYYQAISSSIAVEKPDEQLESLEDRRRQALTVVQLITRQFQARLLQDDGGDTYFSQVSISIPEPMLSDFIRDFVSTIEENLLSKWRAYGAETTTAPQITVELASFISKVPKEEK